MYNLICNSKWCPCACGGPTHFSSCRPVTYDECYLQENRTCSLTIPTSNQTTASVSYDLNILTLDHEGIAWGFCMRAIQAENVILRADFFDQFQDLIAIAKKNVRCEVCHEFKDVTAFFEIPCDACSVQLSIEFSGTLTACTFYAPFAYYVD